MDLDVHLTLNVMTSWIWAFLVIARNLWSSDVD